ncbi:MAG TPA: phosphopantetheine-binding protein [Trebonia sp.]|nr:phosphopantetheine-binding protein [Trebonia sp.]
MLSYGELAELAGEFEAAGKIQRWRLAPSRERCDPEMNPALDETVDSGCQRPRDPVEIRLARQWQHILGFAVGIRENFFGVGGNSLDAARVIDAILVEFGVQLPLQALTGHPTVERLATLLRDHAGRLSGPLPATALPATAVQRAHECGADGHLAGALRELLAGQR